MNENDFKAVLAEICDEEIFELNKFPPFKTSLRHKIAMRKIFADYEKSTHNSANFCENKSPSRHAPLSLRKRLIIALIVIICAALMTGFMAVYISRSFHGTVYRDNTQLFAVDTENCLTTIEYEYYLPDLPDGFEPVEHDLTRTDFYMRYENTSFGQVITLTQYTKNGFNTHYNTEYHNFDEIEINGHSGVCLDISNGECDGSIVIWDNGDYILEIVGNLPKNHLVDLAKSTKVLENWILWGILLTLKKD